MTKRRDIDDKIDEFLRDCERVSTLGSLLEPRKPPPTLKEIRPGVFVTNEQQPEGPAVSIFRKMRDALKQGDQLGRDIGKKFRDEIS